jgi:hypothetical protein
MNNENMKYSTIGFYTLLAFQRYIICNFWTYGLKDMKVTSLQIIEFKLNLIETKKGHVAASDRHVLVRPDP